MAKRIEYRKLGESTWIVDGETDGATPYVIDGLDYTEAEEVTYEVRSYDTVTKRFSNVARLTGLPQSEVDRLQLFKALDQYTTQELETGLSQAQLDSLQYPLSSYTVQELRDGLTSEQLADLQAPLKPTGLSTTNLASDSVDLNWEEAQDNESSLILYRLFRDGVFIDHTSGLSFKFTDLEPGTEYTLEVSAVDEDGNESEKASLDVTTSLGVNPKTLAFQTRVLADGGKINDLNALDVFYNKLDSLGLYTSFQFGVRKQFGYRVDGSGNIDKIYDISQNGNDLTYDVDSGATMAEDIANEMFFLNNAWYSDETVTMPVIGDKFTFLTDVNHPNPQVNARNNVFSIGGIDFWIGGSYFDGTNTIAYQHTGKAVRFLSNAQAFNNANDQNILRKVAARFEKSIAQNILKDGVDMGVFNNTIAGASFADPVTKIVLGHRDGEVANLDADCYLNRSYFFNEYLSDAQVAEIQGL